MSLGRPRGSRQSYRSVSSSPGRESGAPDPAGAAPQPTPETCNAYLSGNEEEGVAHLPLAHLTCPHPVLGRERRERLASPTWGSPIVRFFHGRARLDSPRGQACGVGTPAFSSPCRRRSHVTGPALWSVQASGGGGLWEPCPPEASSHWGRSRRAARLPGATGPRAAGFRNQHGDWVYGTQFWTNDISSLFYLQVR